MSRIVYLFMIVLSLYTSTSTAQSTLQTVNGTINLLVGTASGCPFAANFVTTQVVETYEKYKQFLNVEFVPWGRTRREGGNLICQFGEGDCWANRLKRCVLHLLSGNMDAQVQYMVCEFSTFAAFRQRSFSCALEVGLRLIEVDYCMTVTGDALEGPAEEVSAPAIVTINAIPFTILNNVIDVVLHAQARQRLESTICFALADDPTTGITHCKL